MTSIARIRPALVAAGISLCAGRINAITVEVADGESEAVKIAAENLRRDLDKVCPKHKNDMRKIVVRTCAAELAPQSWESSRRTYTGGVWTVTGADRRGTVYGIYKISEELGVSPFWWWDDIPVMPHEFDLTTETVEIKSPAVKYRGIFINDEDWGLKPWCEKNFEADATRSIGAKTYEKIFEMMLRCRLNYIWPAMHECSYEFISRPENMELADRMGIVVGTSHCEPMLRNNCFLPKDFPDWNYAISKDAIDDYWMWAATNYGKYEAVWTIGIRGKHDGRMKGPKDTRERIKLLESVFDSQTNMVAKYARPGSELMFCPYKEVLPLYDRGLKVPPEATVLWVNDNNGYVRRLGGPDCKNEGGLYFHTSYLGGPHSYTHLCTTPPALMWYQLGAKCYANNAKKIWMVNVGDVKPADILIFALGRIGWSPEEYGPDAQTKILSEWVESFLTGLTGFSGLSNPTNPNPVNPVNPVKEQIVKHLTEYYTLFFHRKPENMNVAWAAKLSERERTELAGRYSALLAEDEAIESTLPEKLRDAWFDAIGFQIRYASNAGRRFTSDISDEDTIAFARALDARYAALADGKWSGFYRDTTKEPPGYCNRQGGNCWSSQMQWPWNERKKAPFVRTPSADVEWIPASTAKTAAANGGAWTSVAGLGRTGSAMALLPIKPGVGDGAAMEFDLTGKGAGDGKLLIRFLPDYRLWPGLKLRVKVEISGGRVSSRAATEIEVPASNGRYDENSPERRELVMNNAAIAEVPFQGSADKVRIVALDSGVVVDAIAVVPDEKARANHIVTTRFTADPAPVVDGDWLYVFMGDDEQDGKKHNMWGWSLARSNDAKEWADMGCVMSVRKTFPWARGNRAWASQAIKRGEKWYWYVTVFRKGGDSCIAVAIADKPEGPWKDALGKPLLEGHGYIDPTVFIDDDEQAWLFWGNCAGDPGLWYAPLNESMIELSGEVKPVPGLMDEAAFGKPFKKKSGAGAKKPLCTNFEEAPWIYKAGDTYFLEYAAGGTPEHWAYSTAKSIHGPWTYRGKILGESHNTTTSHGGSILFKGQWYMVNHDGALPGGGNIQRSAYIIPYSRNADGTIPLIGEKR